MSEASPVLTVTTPVRLRPMPTARSADALDQLGRLEQLVEVGAADDAGCIERGVRRTRLARERAGVGDRGGPRLLAAADLDDHDRLAELERPVGQGQEPLRPRKPSRNRMTDVVSGSSRQ